MHNNAFKQESIGSDSIDLYRFRPNLSLEAAIENQKASDKAKSIESDPIDLKKSFLIILLLSAKSHAGWFSPSPQELYAAGQFRMAINKNSYNKSLNWTPVSAVAC